MKDADGYSEVTVLVMNMTGYKNLISVISQAYIERNAIDDVAIEYAWLEAANEGLIILLGKKVILAEHCLTPIASKERLCCHSGCSTSLSVFILS